MRLAGKWPLKQVWEPTAHDADLRPVVIIPGYGMNAHIFGYHPSDISLEEFLAQQGFEVWSLNMRGQDPSRCLRGGSKDYTMADIVTVDLPVANPVLCIPSNADGIVPIESAQSILMAVSSSVKDFFVAGNADIKMAHADMFISRYSRELVFEPVAEWLLKQY